MPADTPTVEVCQMDGITPKGRWRRGVMGAIWLTLGAVGAVWYASHGAARQERWPLFAAFFLGGVGVFQATQKVCVALAFRGQRETDEGGYANVDAQDLAVHRLRARAVWLRSFGLAAVLTALALIP